MEIYTTVSFYNSEINCSYRSVIATTNQEEAKEIIGSNIELFISLSPEDNAAAMSELRTVFTVYSLFPGSYLKINPFNINFYQSDRGRVFIEITEWTQKCSINNCEIPAKSTCVKYDIVSTKTGKPEIYYICPSCACDYFNKIIRKDFQRFVNALSFKSYFYKCIAINKDSYLDQIFKGE